MMINSFKNNICKKILLSALCLLLFFLCGCGAEKNTASPVKGYSVKDEFGYTLHFTEKPQKIVGTTASIEEVLVDLVPPQKIVAISKLSSDKEVSLIPEQAAKIKTKIPDRASIETIVALHPDLVFMQIKGNQAMSDTLTEMGIKVYRMQTPVTLPMIRDRIRNMSLAVGEPERGDEVLRALDAKVAEVKKRTEKIPKDKRMKVLGFSSLGPTGSSTGLFHQICEESGVINAGALAGAEYATKISDEQIIKVDPDIFIVTDDGPENDHGKVIVRNILADEAIKGVKAVKNRRFIYLKYRYKYANSQYFGDAVTAIAKDAYPELFEGR